MTSLQELIGEFELQEHEKPKPPRKLTNVLLGVIIILLLLILGWLMLSSRGSNEIVLGQVGPAGSPGLDGKSGSDGSPGEAGRDGADGLAGRDGSQGPAGPQGMPGAPGVTGPAGEQGPPGQDGTSIGYGAGEVGIATCDEQIGIKLTSRYDGDDFFLSKLTLLDIAEACAGLTLNVFVMSGDADGGWVLQGQAMDLAISVPEFVIDAADFDTPNIPSRPLTKVAIEVAN